MLAITIVQKYLKKYGWEFDLLETDVILTDFMTQEEIRFFVIMRLAHPWLRIYIPAFLEIRDERFLADLSLQLLKINYLSRQAFFALTDKNDVTLCVDLYTGNGLSYENFETALDTLTYMAEKSYAPLTDFLSGTGGMEI